MTNWIAPLETPWIAFRCGRVLRHGIEKAPHRYCRQIADRQLFINLSSHG